MKSLVVYDSQYGNTEKIAKAIGGAIGAEVKVVRFGDVKAAELGSYDLLFIGSPTQGGRYTMSMKGFLDAIPSGSLANVRVASFDTRLKTKLVKIFGYAATRIADTLKIKGGNLVAPAEGFLVKSAKGPILGGELERAAAWAKSLADKK
jgi:flavodoxin I